MTPNVTALLLLLVLLTSSASTATVLGIASPFEPLDRRGLLEIAPGICGANMSAMTSFQIDGSVTELKNAIVRPLEATAISKPS